MEGHAILEFDGDRQVDIFSDFDSQLHLLQILRSFLGSFTSNVNHFMNDP